MKKLELSVGSRERRSPTESPAPPLSASNKFRPSILEAIKKYHPVVIGEGYHTNTKKPYS